LLDQWRLFDNSGPQPVFVAEEKDKHLHVANASLLAEIEQRSNVQIVTGQKRDRVEEPPSFAPEEETRRAIRAMRKAYADAVLENLSFGLPMIHRRNGKVVEVPAEELAPLARRILEANGEPLPEEEAGFAFGSG
jgi:hypothetical protein